MSAATLVDAFNTCALIKDFEAMPTLATFLDDENTAVRNAARKGLRSFRKNAIWQYREAYLNLVGSEADATWGWQKLANELETTLDNSREHMLVEALKKARGLLARGDLQQAKRVLDLALIDVVEPRNGPAIALFYARLSQAFFANGDKAKARRCALRAAALDEGYHTIAANLALQRSEREYGLKGGALVDSDAIYAQLDRKRLARQRSSEETTIIGEVTGGSSEYSRQR